VGWDERVDVTYVQRGKEDAPDYRYFPEPDLPPLAIDRVWVDQLRGGLPELPPALRARLIRDYGLSPSEVDRLVAHEGVPRFFEAAAAMQRVDAHSIADRITNVLFRVMKATGRGIDQLPITPQALVDLIAMVDAGTLNLNTGRDVLEEMACTGRGAQEIVAARRLGRISDHDVLREIVIGVIAEHPRQVQEYLQGREQVLGWFMGQVMGTTDGRADPQVARRLLLTLLEARRG
jgi:aspartyl-tRNA(Asn)/glutamyl-tRNA(Gln) amidotransferase subunit B